MAIKDKIILIIDDDPEIIKLLSKIFEVLGVVVCSAQNLTEAKKILLSKIPHLIFLDINLGQENGLDYIKYLNSLPFCKSIPVIVFSGVSDKKILEEARRCRPADIIEKPIVASLLIQKVRKFLKESGSIQIVFEDYQNNPQLLTVKGEILKINEEYIEVKSNVKIFSSTYLKLKSPLCEKIGFTDGKFISGDFVISSDIGSYLNRFYYVGASDIVFQKIKALRKK